MGGAGAGAGAGGAGGVGVGLVIHISHVGCSGPWRARKTPRAGIARGVTAWYMGNLSVVDRGAYIGYVDLLDGTVVFFAEENRGPAS